MDDNSERPEFTLERAWELLMGSLDDIFQGFIDHLPNIALAVFVLVLTWALAWAVQRLYWRIMGKRRLRRSLKELIIKLVTIGMWVGGMLAASIVVFPSIKPESVLAGLGLSSIAIGFAFKDIVENFFAGFLILVREPMEIGDVVECEGVEGRVEQITIRDTLIRQTDGQRVLMPNGMIFKNPVWIRTDRKHRRASLTCGVSYDSDLDESRKVITKAVESAESVRADPAPQVFAKEFGANSIDFEVTWWTGSEPVDVRRSRDEVVAGIKVALDRAEIEIPFPQRVLHLPEDWTAPESEASGE